MASETEVTAMRRALQLAVDPLAPLGPNPRVGAVILDTAGVEVGDGCHLGAGTDHAEVVALRKAGVRATGGTAVVTLEPCTHHGRTGPCTGALVAAGVRRVVYGQPDTGARAAGGAQALRAAGLAVEGGVLADVAASINPEFSEARRRNRAYVTYKFATSLDGRIAAVDRTSQWITGESARRDAHRQRAAVDAILVGTGTVLADNPSLTVRGVTSCRHTPLRVVMGLRDLPRGCALLDDAAPTLHLRTRDPAQALSELTDRGVHHVLVEGGPTVAAAFLGHGLVDRVVAYVAPMLLGSGVPALADIGIGTLGDALRLFDPEFTQLDEDVRISGTIGARTLQSSQNTSGGE